MTSFKSLFIPLLLALCVSAHGYVATVTIAGKSYEGNVPNASPTNSIIRQIDDVSPVKGASNPYLNCGQDAQLAALSGSAMPGDTMTFSWKGGDGSNWPHNTGPLLFYMTTCGSEDCSKFNTSDSLWFKIAEIGRESNGDWVQQELMDGQPSNVTLPSNLAPGNYVLRHEIIALHLAETEGGAEFYPSCTQLVVGGSGTGTATASEMVKFPGGYSDTDPGIFDKNAYDPSVPYPFPGPPIAAFVSGNTTSTSSSSSSGTGASASSVHSASGSSTKTSSSSSVSSTASTDTSTSSKCSLKKRSAAVARRQVKAHKPRHLSRIMRNLILEGKLTSP